MLNKYDDYISYLITKNNQVYSNKQKTFWFTEIIKNGLETMINIYITSICQLSFFNFNLTREEEIKIIENKTKEIISLIKMNDQKTIEEIDAILDVKNPVSSEKYEELREKILFTHTFWNSNYVSFFGSRGIGKTLHFQNTLINYSKDIIGISKENFDEIFSQNFINSFLIKIKNENIKIVMIDALNQSIRKENEFNIFLRKVLFIANDKKMKIITITPSKIIDYPWFNELFGKKEFCFFEFHNKLSHSEKEVIYKNCNNFDKELMKFLITNLDDNPRSAILLKNSIESLAKKNKQSDWKSKRKDWSIIKYLRLLTEYYIKKVDSQNSNFQISKKAWTWLKENASLIFNKKCYEKEASSEVLNYLQEINLIDVETKKVKMKDKLFFVLLFVYTNLQKPSKENYQEFEKNINRMFYEKDLSLLISLSGIYIFETWRRSRGNQEIIHLIRKNYNNFKSIRRNKNFKSWSLENNVFEKINLEKLENSILKNISNLMILDMLESNSNFYLDAEKGVISKNKWVSSYADINILILFLKVNHVSYEKKHNELSTKLAAYFSFRKFKNSFNICQNNKIDILVNFAEDILKLDFLEETNKTNKFFLLILKKIFFSFDKNMLQIIKSLIIFKEIKGQTLLLNLFCNLLTNELKKIASSNKYNRAYEDALIYLYYSLLINILEDIKSSPKEMQKYFTKMRENFLVKKIKSLTETNNLKETFSFNRIKYLNSINYKKNIDYFHKRDKKSKKSITTIAELNSYFFNKLVMDFLNSKFYSVYGYDSDISEETIEFLKKINLKFNEYFPNELKYKINLDPKIEYVYKPHSMTYKDWILVLIMDQQTFFEKTDTEIKINDFGKFIFKDEILFENPINYEFPLTYNFMEDKALSKFIEITDKLLKIFKDDKKNLFLKSKNDDFYGIWFVLIKVTNNLGLNWNVFQNPSGLNVFSFENYEDKEDTIESTLLTEIDGEFFSFDIIFENEKLNNSSNYDISPGAWIDPKNSYSWYETAIPNNKKWYKSRFENEKLTFQTTESNILIKSKFKTQNNIYCYFESSRRAYARRWIGIKEIDNKEQVINDKVSFLYEEINLKK